MEREYVESTLMASYGYDETTSILEVEFKKNGAVWQYFDVPESVYWEMKSAGSVGKFFLSSIKGNYTELQVG
ncbi:MAG TPA: KTSC domain-containing protein [Flavobacterium sp.]|uniref:KTSC domain-containing protein n=1 Tax=unclassified Flavobacterium TaxID=196869 RepID=UPI0025BBCDFE|nr:MULTISPECIES: KTSC domain-containing protein [unclassified Flavobacterium]HRE76443.1 KTSC domain-containing protein [Flavobacterium sp.]